MFSGDHWWESGTSWDTATDVTVSSAQPVTLDAALVPTTGTLWGDTYHRESSNISNIPVEVFRADTRELVATATSVDWSFGDPIEGIPCSGRGSFGCYQFDLPAGHVYWVRVAGSEFFGMADGQFGIELGNEGRQVDVHQPYWGGIFDGRVVDPDGDPIAGARVIRIPFSEPVPPMPHEDTTGADGTWRSGLPAHRAYRLLVVGPDGDWTFAGMVDGDPETATVFTADVGEDVHVGDITLGDP